MKYHRSQERISAIEAARRDVAFLLRTKGYLQSSGKAEEVLNELCKKLIDHPLSSKK